MTALQSALDTLRRASREGAPAALPAPAVGALLAEVDALRAQEAGWRREVDAARAVLAACRGILAATRAAIDLAAVPCEGRIGGLVEARRKVPA